MDQSKKGLTNNLTCEVCKIDFNSNADYALHEFSKRHCDNLIKLAKQKPIANKQKTKNEKESHVEKEPTKVTSVAHTGTFAKYGYFIPGEIYTNPETSREFNYDYDPYLQKFPENPLNEKPNLPSTTEATTFFSVTSFSKKKKKKIKTCQVCNVTLATVPEYEAHMKSPSHIWKLKVSGMGVSAHFVKASSDLHTADVNDEPKPACQVEDQLSAETITNTECSNSGPFPLLYCSDCELLLNSPQQYNAHISGKSHLECAQRKAELKAKKEKSENPSPNQLFCYSCKISLNNIFQYNEHKNGKKHKSKCRNLVRKGITIPPEERVPGIPNPAPYRQVVYPELYEKLVLEKQKQADSKPETDSEIQYKDERNTVTNMSSTSSILTTQSENFADNPTNSLNDEDTERPTIESDSYKTSKVSFQNDCSIPENVESDLNHNNPVPEALSSHFGAESKNPSDCPDIVSETYETGISKRQITIITDNSPINCSICNESFQCQSQLDVHFNSEIHLRKILELKLNGRSESDILSTLFSDRDVVKPNNLNKLVCSICNVTVENNVEFDQHINSIVHRYTEKDYRMKRTLEVKHISACNEDGLYFCKICKEGWPSLVEYTQHLHFVKHKTIQRNHRAMAVLAKRRRAYVQKSKFVQSLKKRNIPLRRVKTGKNPGSKACGMAVELNRDTQAPVSNSESLNSKIEATMNVGTCEKTSDNALCNIINNNDNDKVKASNIKKRYKITKSNRKMLLNQPKSGSYYDDIPPFMPSGNVIPPLMPGPSFQPRILRPSYGTPNRNWLPFSAPYPPMYGNFCQRPYFRPPRSQRPPWPRDGQLK